MGRQPEIYLSQVANSVSSTETGRGTRINRPAKISYRLLVLLCGGPGTVAVG